MFDNLSEKFAQAFEGLTGNKTLTEEHIDKAVGSVRSALLEADVNFKVVKEFIAQVKERAQGERILKGVKPQELFIKIVHESLTAIMGGHSRELDLDRPGPVAVLVVGLNGQGKTTFCGKLAAHLAARKKKSCLLVPADTFRPAAKKQLQTLAGQIKASCFDSDLSEGPARIATAAMEEARRLRAEVVIIDTAGRLHVDEELMEQLAQVRRALADDNPEVLMVADAMTGQEAVGVAKTFHERIGLSGVVLSKMDSDARGGAALSIRHVTGVPIAYISSGERMKDLEAFHPDRMAGRILDQGDVVSLVEKAQEEIDEKEAQNMIKKMEKGRFSIEDLIKQMEMIKKMGPLTGLLKMLPGMGGALRQMGDIAPAEDEMIRMRVIVGSMTRQEKRDYKIIKESRIKRIALGSGQSVKEVGDFLARFRQMEKMMGNLGPMLSGAQGGQAMGMPDAASMMRKKPRKKNKRGPWGKGYFS